MKHEDVTEKRIEVEWLFTLSGSSILPGLPPSVSFLISMIITEICLKEKMTSGGTVASGNNPALIPAFEFCPWPTQPQKTSLAFSEVTMLGETNCFNKLRNKSSNKLKKPGIVFHSEHLCEIMNPRHKDIPS